MPEDDPDPIVLAQFFKQTFAQLKHVENSIVESADSLGRSGSDKIRQTAESTINGIIHRHPPVQNITKYPEPDWNSAPPELQVHPISTPVVPESPDLVQDELPLFNNSTNTAPAKLTTIQRIEREMDFLTSDVRCIKAALVEIKNILTEIDAKLSKKSERSTQAKKRPKLPTAFDSD